MSTDDLNSRLKAGIKEANEGRTKDLGDFAQYARREPAWKAEMAELIDTFLGDITMYGEVAETSGRIAEMFTARIGPHIRAAEQRGFQAGVNKTGDSVGKLREQLKTARESILNSFVCGVCGHRVGWVDCPTGGWWSHEVHPSDDHDAEGCVPESDEP